MKDAKGMKPLDRFFEPEGWKTDHFTSTSGKKIRYGHAEPDGPAKGTVVITTGYADFREAYHETINEYLQRGYAVWMMDWAGHGGSEKRDPAHPKKGQTVEDHIEDLRKFRQEIVKPHADKPVFLSTHSMGGQIALHYLAQHQNDFTAAMLATPLVEAKLKGPTVEFLKVAYASALYYGCADEPIVDGRRNLTRGLTEERAGLKEQNPLRMTLHKSLMLLDENLKAEDPAVGYVVSLLFSTEQSAKPEFQKSIKTPILFGVGTEDDVIDNDAVRRAAKTIPNAKSVDIEGGIHALWLDRDAQRKEWWSHIDRWMDQHSKIFSPPPPSNAAHHKPTPKGPAS